MPESDAAVRRLTFVESLARESDRGLVLVGAARLDTLLEKLLRTKLLKCAHSSKGDLDWLLANPLAPLRSFGVRTRLANALGLISGPARKSLDAIRDIRNMCAHEENWKTEKITKKAKSWPNQLVSCPKADYAGRGDTLKTGFTELKEAINTYAPDMGEAPRLADFYYLLYGWSSCQVNHGGGKRLIPVLVGRDPLCQDVRRHAGIRREGEPAFPHGIRDIVPPVVDLADVRPRKPQNVGRFVRVVEVGGGEQFGGDAGKFRCGIHLISLS